MYLTTGSNLGPYEIRAMIGVGGMGEVYKSRDHQLGRDAAIKVLPEHISAQKEALARLENEAHLASSLNHPNIVTIYSIGWEGQRRYIAMEFIDGSTLQELMKAGPMPADRALKIAAQMADGLAKAHEAGIIHRDLNPKNVMLTKDEIVKILDFGLSKFALPHELDSQSSTPTYVDSADGLTKPGTIVGTVEYMSPEQAAGRPLDFRSDQFSMGSLIYAILTGNKPFHRQTPVQTLSYIIEGEPQPISRFNPQVPKSFEDIIRQCMMKDSRDRYPSTRELARDLHELESAGGMGTRRWTRRDWIRASLGIGAPLVAGGGIWIWALRPYQPEPAALDWYQKGLAALHSMTFESARRAFDQAVAADPKFALAHANLAMAYDELDYSEHAKESMVSAMAAAQEIRLSNSDRKRLRALQLMVSRDYDRAFSLFRELENDAGGREKAAAALECGWVAQKREDTEAAAAAYERALRIDPAYPAARLRLGYIQQRRLQDDLAEKNFEEAEKLYRAESNNEGVTESLWQQANLLNRRARADAAMPLIEKAINLATALVNRFQEIRLRILQSAVVSKTRQYKRAAELAQQAIDAAKAEGMDNLVISGTIALGNVFFRNGDLDSAEMHFRNALNLAQNGKVQRYEAMAWVSLGSTFEQKNHPEEARRYIEAALPFYRQAGYRREFSQATTILVGVLCQLGEFDQSIKLLREALYGTKQLKETEADLRERLAEILQHKGAWPEALLESERAASLPGSGMETRLNYSGLYWRLGRRQDAEQCWSAVEQLLQKNADQHMLAVLRLRQAEIAYAESRFQQAKANAGMSIAALSKPDDRIGQEAKLIEALVSIRTQRGNEGNQTALAILQDFEKSKLPCSAASASLLIAEALADVNERSRARKLAMESLVFFERHEIWESIWRCYAVAGRTSDEPAEAEAHRAAARSALDQLRKSWPSRDVESYLRRPDIRQLSRDLHI
jgi:tetratricopeptide (TPR) repeat protein